MKRKLKYEFKLGLISIIILNLIVLQPPEPAIGSDKNVTQPISDIILDPTRKNEYYSLDKYPETFFELLGSRGQTSRHFFNKSNEKYIYKSDYLVQKQGLFEETNWVTFNEYPNEFFIQLRDGSTKSFKSPTSAHKYIQSSDLSQISKVGLETFSGILGFNLDFLDSEGHGQYLYWPRLADGTLPPLQTPVCEVYTHLYTKKQNKWSDAVLQNKALFNFTYDPQKSLDFYTTDSTIEITFETPAMVIEDSVCNVLHGFKYNLHDRLFHMATEIESISHDYEDIGVTYELLSPTLTNSLLQISDYIISNNERAFRLSNNETWNAAEYLEDYNSEVELITNQGDSFRFSFDDMQETGFSESTLSFHCLNLPNEMVHNTIQAGMFGLGSVPKGTRITIDPTFGPASSSDNYDLFYCDHMGWVTDLGNNYAGRNTKYYSGEWLLGFIAWNTGIESKVLDTFNVNMTVFMESNEFESGEGVDAWVYNVLGNNDAAQAREDSTSYTLTKYNHTQTHVIDGPDITSGWNEFNWMKMESLTDYWASNRYDFNEYISFKFTGSSECDGNELFGDYCKWRDYSWCYGPQLTFEYTLETTSSQNAYVGSYSNNYCWSDPDEVYINDGTSASCVTSLGQIDYALNQAQFASLNSSLQLTQWLGYTCNILIEWKVTDAGGYPEALDDLEVCFYHKSSDSWTGWIDLHHIDENWHISTVTETTRYWFPNDLKYLQIRIRHEVAVPNPDEIEVDFILLQVNNGTKSWNCYLGSDWARHPTNQEIQEWASNLVAGAYDKAFNIQDKTVREWNHDDGVDNPDTWKFWNDTAILDTRKDDPDEEYKMICFQDAVILTSYARAVGIPSRVIYFKSIGRLHKNTDYMDHASTEFYIYNDWVPVDSDDEYWWFDKTTQTKDNISSELTGYHHGFYFKIDDIWIYITVDGELTSPDDNTAVLMSVHDPEQYSWYESFLEFD